MGIVSEFADFLKKYQVIGLAVAFIIGAASTKLVTAIANDLVMPIVGALVPGGDWRLAILQVGPVKFLIGDFAGALIDFLIIALVVFAASRLPPPTTRGGGVPGNLVLFGCAWAATTAFMIAFGMRRLGPIVDLLLMLALLALYARLLLRLPALAPSSKVAMAAGVYAAPTFAALAGGHFFLAAIAALVMLFAWRRAAQIPS